MNNTEKNEILKIDNLNVQFAVKGGMLSAVHGVQFSIDKGEIYALVGESGCGKSTVAHSVMGLLEPDSTNVDGSVMFKDQQLIDAPERMLEKIRGRGIGMIFQNPLDSLNPVYRSGSQVAEAILLDDSNKKDAWRKVEALYQDVRIPDSKKRTKSFPHELSGGMRQRVMIAMMLSRQPELLICDEPTTALDVTIEAQILDIIRDLREKHGTSFLIITHNFGIVAELADRIGVMYAGELIEEGDVFEIFDNPLHPYTKALLKALPNQSKDEGRLETIDGVVPRILGEFKGCRFENRCPLACDICREASPGRKTNSKEHMVRCHLAEVK